MSDTKRKFPEKAGLYWARTPGNYRYDRIIMLEGNAPFLRARVMVYPAMFHHHAETLRLEEYEWGPEIVEPPADGKRKKKLGEAIARAASPLRIRKASEGGLL